MKYQIQGDSDCPLVHIHLDKNEVVKIERGAMAYLSNVELSGKMNSKKKGVGGLCSSFSTRKNTVFKSGFHASILFKHRCFSLL